jgi:hypothetical protein
MRRSLRASSSGSTRAANISAAVLAIACTSLTAAEAHPGSGIVVDARGRVYFTDTGKGIARVDEAGRLSYVPGEAFHWMAMDEKGAFARAPADLGGGFQRLTAAGQRPALVTASDFPFTFAPDGLLYYPGPSGLHRRHPNGRDDVFVSRTKSGNLLPSITGAASGPDGSLYLMSLDGSNPDEGTDQHTIVQVVGDGRAVVFARNFITPAVVGPTEPVPGSRRTYSRGLAIDKSGTVFVAVTGSRVVLAIDARKKVRVALRAEPPWTPTGVAVHASRLYVLEYDVTPVPAREWPPRVRTLDRTGTVTILVTLPRDR